MMDKLEPIGVEKIEFEGTVFQVVSTEMNVGNKTVNYEQVRRSPGTRLIIVKDGKLLLVKEYRHELKGYDYRLPGGKVFDKLIDYKVALKEKQDFLYLATEAAKKECAEEVGLIVKKIRHLETARAGATVNWDLYYFIVDEFEEGVQKLELGEVIRPIWTSLGDVKKMCIDHKIKEDRTVGVLTRFLLINGFI